MAKKKEKIVSLGQFNEVSDAMSAVLTADIKAGVSEPEINVSYSGKDSITLFFTTAVITGKTASAVVWF